MDRALPQSVLDAAGGKMTAEEERSAAEASRAGSKVARDRLVTAHAWLAYRMALEFRSYGLPVEELGAEALLALAVAAERFDPDKGARFSAYAAWWVKERLRRYTLNNRGPTRAPTTRAGRKLLARLRTYQREFAKREGREPTAAEAAAAFGCTESEVHEVERYLSNRGVPADEVQVAAPEPDEEEFEPDAAARVREALRALPRREREVIRMRYLAGTEEPVPRHEVGRRFGVGRSRVWQIEQSALRLLREALVG